MKKRPDILTSPAFVAALALLLLNDFALKPLFGNALTGKLSDFAGLFVFPLFWAALFPRLRGAFYVLTAALFTFWKTELSTPAVEAAGRLAGLHFERAVDYTDLLALFALPASYAYGAREPRAAPRLAPYAVGVVSLFAFAATQPVRHRLDYDQKYYFDIPRQELFERVNRQQMAGYELGRPPACCPGEVLDFFDARLDGVCGPRGAAARVQVTHEGERRSALRLAYVTHGCGEGRVRRGEALEAFEREVVRKLHSGR